MVPNPSVDNRPIVVLVGAPGAGKTRAGKRVARLLGAEFIDTDKKIVAEHGPIAALFDTHGEPHFRALERAAVSAALRRHAVVSLGGGAVLDRDTRADLAGLPVVQLTTSAAAVAQRIRDGKRPLLRDGTAAWEALVAARTPLYDAVSSVTFDTSSTSMTAVAERIVAWLREHPGGTP